MVETKHLPTLYPRGRAPEAGKRQRAALGCWIRCWFPLIDWGARHLLVFHLETRDGATPRKPSGASVNPKNGTKTEHLHHGHHQKPRSVPIVGICRMRRRVREIRYASLEGWSAKAKRKRPCFMGCFMSENWKHTSQISLRQKSTRLLLLSTKNSPGIHGSELPRETPPPQ